MSKTSNIPATMRGLVLREHGYASNAQAVPTAFANASQFLELADLSVPQPGAGQVLIRVRRATVNPSDVMFIQGAYGQARVQGVPAGFEGVGQVVAGNGFYPRLLVGRQVAFAVVPGGSGAWADYATTDAAAAIPLIKGVRDEDAAGMIVNPLTAAAMLELVPGAGAFVFSAAASQLGKLIASLAKDQGKHMIGIVRRDTPVAALQALGAVQVLNETDADYPALLAAAINQYKPTVFLDAVAGQSSTAVFDAMGDKTRWVIYGRLATDAPQINEPGELIFLRKRIEGFWLVDWMAKTAWPGKLKTVRQVQRRFRDRRWQTDISQTLALNEVIERLAAELAEPDGKVQIAMR